MKGRRIKRRRKSYSLDTLGNARKEIIKMSAQRLQSPRIEGDSPAAAGAAGGGSGAGSGGRGDRTETMLLRCDVREVLV